MFAEGGHSEVERGDRPSAATNRPPRRLFDELAGDSRHFFKNVFGTFTSSFEDVVAMIGGLQPMEPSRWQFGYDLFQQIATGKFIARAGKEEHWLPQRRQMVSASGCWFPGRVERERAENQPTWIEFAIEHSVGGHPSPEGMSAEPKRESGPLFRRSKRVGDRGGCHRGRISSVFTCIHERKVES